MCPTNLSEAARVTASLLDQYGPARLLRVEELAPGIFRGCWPAGPRLWRWSGRTDESPSGRPSRGHKNPRGLSAPGAVDRGSTMRTNVLYHGNVCLTRGNFW